MNVKTETKKKAYEAPTLEKRERFEEVIEALVGPPLTTGKAG
jgi:hypothetical protein